jgi:hypothetical protein
MKNVRCQDWAPEALLENYRALGPAVSIIGRHLPRPAKQVPRWYGGKRKKNWRISVKYSGCVNQVAFIRYKSSGKVY